MPNDLATIEYVVESISRRLDRLPPDSPAAMPLREELQELLAERDRLRGTRDTEGRRVDWMAQWVFPPLIVFFLAVGIEAVFDLTRPDRSTAADVLVLIFAPFLILALTPFAIIAWHNFHRQRRSA